MTCKTPAAALFLVLLPVAALAQSPSTQPSPDRAEMREKFKAACSADIQKFCAQIERAKGAMRACLQAHANELSAECRALRDARAAAKAEKDKATQ
jgi:flagellar motility protein MotE (MotC chaperone)